MIAAGLQDTVLARIAERTVQRVRREKEKEPMRRLLELIATSARAPRPVTPAFKRPGVSVIAEIKRASPSKGRIAPDADPVTVAKEYLDAGARMISVLTEPEFFLGHSSFLSAVRAAFPDALLLMKDFVMEEYQVAQARVLGADSVLLMASLLPPDRLERLLVFARAIDLTPLVEVHDEAELELAKRLGATFIGVNNRDLKTLDVSLDVSRRLAAAAPKGATLIAESGISGPREIRELIAAGYHGFLVGTSLMASGAPGHALRSLLGGAQ